MKREAPMRVAFIAGTLARGGAEKQLTYIAGALTEAGVNVRVLALRQGEHFEDELASRGVPVTWVGRSRSPVIRLGAITAVTRAFRPQIVQSGHFYANLYAALAARMCGALSIGAIRSDVRFEVSDMGRWARPLFSLPDALIANSYTGRRNAIDRGLAPQRIHVLPNVIAAPSPAYRNEPLSRIRVVAISSLVPAKRLDRFVAAVAEARAQVPGLEAVVAGTGPELAALRAAATSCGLPAGALEFVGHTDDVATLLQSAAMLILTSDHEGFPNVVLEAMSAGVPVVTTPAGDAGTIVVDGETGYVVPFDDHVGLVRRIVELGRNPVLRRRLGSAGMQRAATHFSTDGLADRLLSIYGQAAEVRGATLVRELLRRRAAPT